MWFSVEASPESLRLEVSGLLPAPVNSTEPPEHVFLTFNHTEVPPSLACLSQTTRSFQCDIDALDLYFLIIYCFMLTFFSLLCP
jgi:hypothetical protein